jgi:superoxide dismutase, Fe-Mn family
MSTDIDVRHDLGDAGDGFHRRRFLARRLHELYFTSLGGDGQTMVPAMAFALEANFGSVDRWRSEFVAMGRRSAGDRAGCC